MRTRGLVQGVLALALGAAVAALPAVAGSETAPTIEAANYSGGGIYKETHAWSPPGATVGVSGVVTLVNNSSSVEHGVVWSSAIRPACEGVPENRGATSWRGTCTFSQPGTYTFYCYVHPTEMKGSITVNANGTTTSTTSTGTTTTSGGTTTSQGTQPEGAAPLARALNEALSLAHGQRGTRVRGSLNVPQAAVGGRLWVQLLARRAMLAVSHRLVDVGHLSRVSLRAGRLSFQVSVNARARRALRAHRRLPLTVKIALTDWHGSVATRTRSVVLHAR